MQKKKYKATKDNNVLRISKTDYQLEKEKAKKVRELDYITKKELIQTVTQIASIVGVKVDFTLEKEIEKTRR